MAHESSQNRRKGSRRRPGRAGGARKRKKLDYPEVTNGTRWAAEARRLASKMTAAERAEHFRQAMVKIYGGQPKETTGAGR